ncbi:MAG: hypothetical protein HY234_15410 [Acidobacteria bacterium]|nr:hypothetical protein [Acidobacteriota bacterium]
MAAEQCHDRRRDAAPTLAEYPPFYGLQTLLGFRDKLRPRPTVSMQATVRPFFASAPNGRGTHQFRMAAFILLATTLLVSVAAYGLDYYTLDKIDRPHSPKHKLLKPGGRIGLPLGIVGFFLFLGLFLYPLRKRWAWLGKQGSSRHWLDVHVLLGSAAPLVIALHSSFKFNGLVGVAFWIMMAVGLSGIVGRYLYTQIPRNLTAAELSLHEAREMQEQLAKALEAQRLFSKAELSMLFRFPTPEQVQHMPLFLALGCMVGIDSVRPFHVAALRRRAMDARGTLTTLGGFLPAGNAELENVVEIARRKASLAKRILFLSRAQQVFQLWHVVHRPFSYSFAVLATVHVIVVMLFGLL